MQKEPLRIAMLGHKRIPSREGGIEVVVAELAVRLARLGHLVTCYNRGDRPVGVADSSRGLREFEGVRLCRAPAFGRGGLAVLVASFTGALRAALGRYDVVHFHASGPSLMCWLPKLTGKRVVVTIHGLDHRRAKWGRLAKACILAGEKTAVRFADELIVLGADTQRYFWEVYGRKTCWIPNGVTRPVPQGDGCIRALGLQPGGYLLYVGRLVPEKRLPDLLDAFRQVQADKKLVVVGPDPASDPFVQRVKAQAQGDSRVLFTGFVQGQLLAELYANAYLYCLPSDLEGMPLTLLEAMSYGCCCVVSDIPACTAVVENHGVVVPCGDVASLASRLQQLCEDAALVEGYRSQAAEFICAKYPWEPVVQHTLALYRGEKLPEELAVP